MTLKNRSELDEIPRIRSYQTSGVPVIFQRREYHWTNEQSTSESFQRWEEQGSHSTSLHKISIERPRHHQRLQKQCKLV